MSIPGSSWVRWLAVIALLAGAGAIVAAVNWHGIWSSFALIDVQSGTGATGLSTVEAQASFQRWVLVALVSLGVSAGALAIGVLRRPGTDVDDLGAGHREFEGSPHA